MAEVADFFCLESAFFGAEFELCMAKPFEDLSEAGKVLFPGGGEDDDIIQVEEAGFLMEASQDMVHEPGERSGSAAEAKRNLIKLK